MDEDVLAALVGLDESEALLRVEPLHGSGCHFEFHLSGVLSCAASGRAADQILEEVEARPAPEAFRVERRERRTKAIFDGPPFSDFGARYKRGRAFWRTRQSRRLAENRGVRLVWDLAIGGGDQPLGH